MLQVSSFGAKKPWYLQEQPTAQAALELLHPGRWDPVGSSGIEGVLFLMSLGVGSGLASLLPVLPLHHQDQTSRPLGPWWIQFQSKLQGSEGRSRELLLSLPAVPELCGAHLGMTLYREMEEP